jgi:hypothetical protein
LAQETAMRALRTIVAAGLLCVPARAAAADDKPICADRPSKSTGACTVPAGHWQIETGLIDWIGHSSGGVTEDVVAIGSTLLKYGLSDKTDVEIGVMPLLIDRVHGAGMHERASGFGDTVVRVKYRLTAEGAPFEAALDPFVKIPTANHRLGNGKVEGGLVVPMDAPLGKSGLTVSIDPELDIAADEDGHGHHAAMTQVVNLAAAISDKLTVSGEIWGMWDWDPMGTTKQYSADATATYAVKNDLQLDAGVHFGLNRETPDVELYTGVSVRF